LTGKWTGVVEWTMGCTAGNIIVF